MVNVKIEDMSIPTYEAADYEDMPIFGFNRLHQGTTGNPFPHRVVNRVRRDSKIDKTYKAIILENEYIEVVLLPELGGRIFAAKDKTNNRDFFYCHHVIKPALIGIYGLWISGGLEFNWPRHHRPSTFMPCDFTVEHLENGGVIVWMSEHDPLYRMKGMVGVALYPQKAFLETKMRIFNRTSLPHTFHWWENAALPVDENFQVFFPPDVTYVNYHYRKDTGAYPVMDKYFYVQDNRGGRDIRFHKNSENATSYFSGISKYNFFGGYDHAGKAGVIHYASHYTSTGKKMFTWGYKNREKAWENALTDNDGPYVELMAGSYGDNQPDFTWIEPYETKIFSQIWYPYKDLGEVQAATEKAALSYTIENAKMTVKIYSTEDFPGAVLEINGKNGKIESRHLSLKAGKPETVIIDGLTQNQDLCFALNDENNRLILNYQEEKPEPYVPEPAKNIPRPDEYTNADDCCIAGVHINQYSDPLIQPSAYWLKGLEIDPNHTGCLTNMGRYLFEQQNYAEAEKMLRGAVKSLTRYNPNPRDSEAVYLLGLVLKTQKKWDEAIEVFYKSQWSRAQIIPASCCIASIYSAMKKYGEAEELLKTTIENNGKNQKAEELLITLFRKQGKKQEAISTAKNLLRYDMLDLFALNELRLLGEPSLADESFKYRRDETGIDLAEDYNTLGLYEDGLELMKWIFAHEEPTVNLLYAAGYFSSMTGDAHDAKKWYNKAAGAKRGMRFCSSPFEREALEDAILLTNGSRPRNDLGILLLGIKRNVEEAILQWQTALQTDPHYIEALRNLAVGLFNKNNNDPEVLVLLEKALALQPHSLQLIYERNMVAELQNIPVQKRLQMWEAQQVPPESWDEIYIQGVRLLKDMGEYEKALKMLTSHTFIPAEGGEAVLGYEYGSILEALGNNCLQQGKHEEARKYFVDACNSPLSIGGGLLHDVNRVPYRFGEAKCLLNMGKRKEAEEVLSWILNFPVDYFTQSMLPSFLYYRGLAMKLLGREKEGTEILEKMKRDAGNELNRKQYGFFAATSAYSSYMKDPAEQRRKHYTELRDLALDGLKEK